MSVAFRSCVVLLFMMSFAGLAYGEAPTLTELVDGTPLLTPGDEKIESFQFSFETAMVLETELHARVIWKRSDGFGMLMEAGAERTPVWFLSQGKCMFYDASNSSVLLGDAATASFEIQAARDRLNINLGMHTKDEAVTLVDLPSLLSGAKERGQLTRDESGHFVVSLRSQSGRSQIIAVYDDSEKHPIRSLELRNLEDDSLLFAVRDIRVNEAFTMRWPGFPDEDAFPGELKVIATNGEKDASLLGKVGIVATVVRSQLAQIAVRNPEFQKSPIFLLVNWEKAKRTNDLVSPQLRRLLHVESIRIASNADSESR